MLLCAMAVDKEKGRGRAGGQREGEGQVGREGGGVMDERSDN